MMPIVIKRIDGGVSIMTLHEGDDVDVEIAKWDSSNMTPQYVSYREMPDSAIPPNKTWRDAWTDETKELVIDINLERAKAMHSKRLAIEAIEKQRLADVVIDPRTEGAQSLDDLLAIKSEAK
jgi:hypothetical protein